MEGRFLKYLLLFIFAFIAELIDGGMGMGYGVSLTTLLISAGFGTVVSSAAVHMSEIVTSFASGLSHYRLGNFDKKIFTYLVIPGVIGGICGAYTAVQLKDTTIIRFVVASILLVLGLIIIFRYSKKRGILEREYSTPKVSRILPLGFAAAFIDAIGGGGWGPVAAPTLMINNTNPKKAIGSVNFAEFFVTLAISITFFLSLPNIDWSIVIPMIFGGVISAPIAAHVTKKLSYRTLGIAVGTLIAMLSLRTILMTLG